MSNRIPLSASSVVESEKVEVKDEPKVEPVKEALPSGIKVKALRAGFWANMRKVEGDEFEVPSMEKVGSWMKCLDPKMDALHKKHMKDKKKQAGY